MRLFFTYLPRSEPRLPEAARARPERSARDSRESRGELDDAAQTQPTDNLQRRFERAPDVTDSGPRLDHKDA
jgi:hypothetical protein